MSIRTTVFCLLAVVQAVAFARSTDAISGHEAKRLERVGGLLLSSPAFDIHSNDVTKEDGALSCRLDKSQRLIPPYIQLQLKDDVNLVTLSILHKTADLDRDIVPTKLITKTYQGEPRKVRLASDDYALELSGQILEAIQTDCPAVNHVVVDHYFADLFLYETSIDFRSRPFFVPSWEHEIIRTDFSLSGLEWSPTDKLPWSTIPGDQPIHKGQWVRRSGIQWAVWDRDQTKYANVGSAPARSTSGPPNNEDIVAAYIRETSEFGYYKDGPRRLVHQLGAEIVTVDDLQVRDCTAEDAGYRCRYEMTVTIDISAKARILAPLFKIPDALKRTVQQNHLFVSTSSGWRSPTIAGDYEKQRQTRNERALQQTQRYIDEAQQREAEYTLDLLL